LPGKIWKTWLFPGAVLLALSAALVNSPLFPEIAPTISFYYVAVFTAGLVLSRRFNSSRYLFSLLVLMISHRAVGFFAAGQAHTGAGRTAVLLMAFLVPINFALFAVIQERGLVFAGVGPRFALLFLEAVMVAVWCRPENSTRTPASEGLPPWAMLGFVVAVGVFVARYVQTRKLIEPGFVWTSAAVFLWLQFAPIGKMSVAYAATAGLILTASLIETSYVLAYHDELTGIPGRRAFNEALLSLDQQYAIAIVDIDHFKNFNDTYGHDVGDQVLCLVASRLSRVRGGGEAFRCGGEEFSIIFRNTSAKEAFDHLESLRQAVETSAFRVRGGERRSAARAGEPERRRTNRRKVAPTPAPQPSDGLAVTVSVGVAEPSTRYRNPDQVIKAADQALYQAKRGGRNRVELASTTQVRSAKSRRTGVSRI